MRVDDVAGCHLVGRGRTCRESGCHTVKVRPPADQEMMASLAGLLTMFQVFLWEKERRREGLT